MGVNRGLNYWQKGADKRILYTAGPFLYAVNAEDGTLISSFGNAGKVDLHTGLPGHTKDYFINANTPGIIYEDLLIQGSRVSESIEAAPGYIRAFHVETGHLNGPSAPFLNQERKAMRPGPRRPGKLLVEPIPGAASVWIRRKELYLFLQVPPLSTSTVEIAMERIYLLIVSWRSMQIQENAFGIIRSFGTTYGIEIYQLRQI